MKKNYVLLVFVFLFVFLIQPGYTQIVSVDVPLDHWTYDIMDRFTARGLVDVSAMSRKPFSRMQMAAFTKQAIKAIQRMKENKETEALTESLEVDLNKLIEEYTPELVSLGVGELETDYNRHKRTEFSVVHPLKLERIGASLSWNDYKELPNRNGWTLQDGENLRASVRAWGKIEDFFAFSAEPATYYNKRDSFSTFDEAYFRINFKNIDMDVGREALWWGPGRQGSLILSNNMPPLDMFKISNNKPFTLPGKLEDLGTWDATWFFAELKKAGNYSDAKLAGARIDWHVTKKLSLATSRVVMKGGALEGDSIDSGDVIKELFNLKNNESSNVNSNKITAFDAIYRFDNTKKYLLFTDNLITYGQLGFDGEVDSGFSNPAYLYGIYTADIFNKQGLSFRSEYATTESKVNNCWYTQDYFRTGYTNKGRIMGHQMGSDADDLLFRFEKQMFFKEELTLGVEFERQRRGLSISNTEDKKSYGIDLTLLKLEKIACTFAYTFENIYHYLQDPNKKASNHIFEISARVEF